MFGVNSIYGSVQWLGVPDFLKTNGPAWTDNILAPNPSWGDGDTTTNPNCGSQPVGPYGRVAVLWSGTVRVMPYYVRRIPENTCSAARCVRDNIF